MLLKWAVNYLCKQLLKDPDYYRSWQANITMAYMDEIGEKTLHELSYEDQMLLHRLANNSAVRFLNLLLYPLKPCGSNQK